MLNSQVDRVGIAVIASRGVLYSTADYAHSVQALSQTQIEEPGCGTDPAEPRGDWRQHFICACSVLDAEWRASVIWIDASALCHALAGLGSEPSAEAVG